MNLRLVGCIVSGSRLDVRTLLSSLLNLLWAGDVRWQRSMRAAY